MTITLDMIKRKWESQGVGSVDPRPNAFPKGDRVHVTCDVCDRPAAIVSVRADERVWGAVCVNCLPKVDAPTEMTREQLMAEVEWLRRELIGEIGAEDYEAAVEQRRVAALPPDERAAVEAEQAAERAKAQAEHEARWAAYEAQRDPVCDDYPVSVEHSIHLVALRGPFTGGSEIVSLKVEVQTPSAALAMSKELRELIGKYSPPGQVAKVELRVTDRRKP